MLHDTGFYNDSFSIIFLYLYEYLSLAQEQQKLNDLKYGYYDGDEAYYVDGDGEVRVECMFLQLMS